MINRFYLYFVLIIISSDIYGYDLAIIKSGDMKNYDRIIAVFVNYSGLTYKIFNLSSQSPEAVKKFIESNRPKAFFVIGAKAAAFTLKAFPNMPIVYSMILHDEAFSGINNIVGVKGYVSFNSMFKTIKKVDPDIKKIGIIYSDKTQEYTKKLLKFGKYNGFEINVYKIKSKSELNPTLSTLFEENDAFYLQLDPNLIIGSFIKSAIVKSIENRKPIFSFSPVIVKIGAVMAVDVDYNDVAKKAAILVRNIIIKGISPAGMKSVFPSPIIYLNLLIAKKIGIRIPISVISNAVIIRK